MKKGESLPILKFPIEDSNNIFDMIKCKRNVLLECISVIRAKPINDKFVLALVIRTGFSTYKGQIFRAVLFSRAFDYKFVRVAIYFMLILAILVILIYSGYAYVCNDSQP